MNPRGAQDLLYGGDGKNCLDSGTSFALVAGISVVWRYFPGKRSHGANEDMIHRHAMEYASN